MEQIPRTKEQLEQFIGEYITKNISVEVEKDITYSGDVNIEIKILLNSKLISSDWFWLGD